MKKNKIPLCRANIGKEEKIAVNEVLKSGWLTHGDKNKLFEKNFAEYIGVKYAISMNSCTSALFLALVANNIKGEVIIPSFTFVASANAVVTAGATPVFADVDYDTCMLIPESVESAITSKTEAIMTVHYAGQAAPIKELQKICKKHNLLFIEDSAEAIGAEYFGKKTGSFGVGCFSFFPTKNITTGEGGMLTTNNKKMADKISILIAHGIDKKKNPGTVSGYRSASYAGYNFRLSNLLAAIGVEQLKKIDILNKKRKILAKRYNNLLKDVPQISMPKIKENRTHVWQMYTVKVSSKHRNNLVKRLIDSGVEASVHFFPPVHEQIFYKNRFRKRVVLKNTEKLSREILTLPMYPDMKTGDVDYVCKIIREYFTKNKGK